MINSSASVRPPLRGGATVLSLVLVICCASAGRAGAAAVYDSGGFEAPRFVALANLDGQDAPLPGTGGPGPWQKDGGTSAATVQSNFPRGGLQSVRVARDGSASGNTRWGVVTPFSPGASSGVVRIDVDVRVSLAVLGFGPMFGVEAYDASSGSPKLIGGVALDASSGDLLYRKARTGEWLETGALLSRNAYHHLTLAADFASQTYSVLVDGNPLHTGGFVDRTATAFTDAPIVALAAAATSETGIAYFDNYAISSLLSTSTVPEPAAGVLLGIVSCVLATRRRRTEGPCVAQR